MRELVCITSYQSLENAKNFLFLQNKRKRIANPFLRKNDNHLNKKRGGAVFTYELRAVARLKLIENLNPDDEQLVHAIKTVIKKLTKTDYLLAETILNEIKEIDIEDNNFKKIIEKFIAKAERELVKSKEDIENNKPAKSIIHSKKSWHYSQQAIKLIEQSNN